MVNITEGTVDVGGGKSLYTKSWLPDGPPKAKLVFIHGFNDHINRYYDFFPTLAGRGIAVHGFDQRGWGRSVSKPSERGLTGTTQQVLADIAAVLAPHLPRPGTSDDPPCFVMGHSMGGGESLTLACDRAYEESGLTPRVRGWLMESPFVAFAPEQVPSRLTVAAGRLVGKLLPHRQMVQHIPPENVTRDPEVARSLREDPLCHETGTLEGLAAMLDRTAALTEGRVRPSGTAVRALWIGHGTDDKTTSFEASRRYLDEYAVEVKDRTFRAYEGMYHQLHADGPDSQVFFKDVGGLDPGQVR